MKLARDIMSLSTFKRDSNKVMRQMKKTKEPIVLTVNGKAAVVVQDAVRKDDQRKTFSMSSSPRITFQSKIDEKVQGHPPFRCRVGHRIILLDPSTTHDSLLL
jgi:prevent-host-death family protein